VTYKDGAFVDRFTVYDLDYLRLKVAALTARIPVIRMALRMGGDRVVLADGLRRMKAERAKLAG
jgi:hypothetical protein